MGVELPNPDPQTDPDMETIRAKIEELTHKPDDLLETVLRGHLMIEQTLERAILAWFPSPAPYYEGKFGFHHKLCLVHALNVRHPQEPIWGALGALNSLRNDFAHRLTSAERENKIRRFVELTESDFAEMRPPELDLSELTVRERLIHAFSYLLSSADQMRVEYEGRARLASVVGAVFLRENYEWSDSEKQSKTR